MNKIFLFLIFLIFVTSCSFNKNSKFWTESKKILKDDDTVYKEIFIKEEALSKELNTNITINLGKKDFNVNVNNNYFNNSGRLNFNGALKKSSRYKFSKIKNFH